MYQGKEGEGTRVPKSDGPTVRSVMEMFFGSVDVADIVDALQPVMLDQASDLDSVRNVRLNLEFLLSQGGKFDQRDVALGMEVSKINALLVWDKLIRKALANSPALNSQLFQGLRVAHPERTIHVQNGPFLQEGSVMLAMGAKYGPNFKDKFPFLVRQHARITQPAIIIAERFSNPSSSPQVLFDRLGEVFSAPLEGGESPALLALKKGKGFVNRHPTMYREEVLVCPAVDFTANLYGAYSTFLRNPDYRQVFIGNLSTQVATRSSSI